MCRLRITFWREDNRSLFYRSFGPNKACTLLTCFVCQRLTVEIILKLKLITKIKRRL